VSEDDRKGFLDARPGERIDMRDGLEEEEG
jgi:hypothetical protein